VALDELLADFELTADAVAYAGDDLIDLPVLRRVGVAITVSDARRQVINEADWVTVAPGGRGAVREMADTILETRGELQAAIDELLSQWDRV
jgi:3-deoxy-D-manno-octulosonate 8-phosphate phosphatase (KDO 8-P phosphatase)